MVSKKTKIMIAVILVSTFLYITNIINKVNQAPEPIFSGYESLPMRIKPVNLTELRLLRTIETKISKNPHRLDSVSVYWDEYLGHRRAKFSYSYVSGKGSYSFYFGRGNKHVLPKFWVKVQRYFHLSDFELQTEITKYERRYDDKVDGTDQSASGAIPGTKPDFNLIKEDLRNTATPLSVDTSQVGYEEMFFNDSAWLKINTESLIIETKVEDPSVSIKVLIDKDSDIQVSMVCRERLDDPKSTLNELFNYLGLSTTILDSLILEETYWRRY